MLCTITGKGGIKRKGDVCAFMELYSVQKDSEETTKEIPSHSGNYYGENKKL